MHRRSVSAGNMLSRSLSQFLSIFPFPCCLPGLSRLPDGRLLLDRTGSKLWRESAKRCRNVRVRWYATQAQCPRDSGPSDHNLQNRGNKARMFMKTKEEDKRSQAGADIAFECLRCAEGAVRAKCTARPDLSLRDIADPHTSGVCATHRIGNWRNKARMSMKTKSRGVEKSWSSKVEAKSRRIGPGSDNLSLLHSQLSTARLDGLSCRRHD